MKKKASKKVTTKKKMARKSSTRMKNDNSSVESGYTIVAKTSKPSFTKNMISKMMAITKS